MPELLLSALVQTPFVLVMVYLVHRFLTHLDAHDAAWREFTEQTNARLGDRLDGLRDSIDHLALLIRDHDTATRSPINGRDVRTAQDELTARRAGRRR